MWHQADAATTSSQIKHSLRMSASPARARQTKLDAFTSQITPAKPGVTSLSFPFISLSPTHTHERENNKGVTTCSTTIRNMQYLNTIFDFWIPSMKRFISFFRITTCMVYTFVQPYPYLLRVDTGSSTPYTPRMCVRSEHNLLRKLGHNLCMSSSRGVCGLASARLADVRSQPHQPEHNHLRLCLYCILTTKFRFFHLIHAYIPLSVQNIY